jgi:hypothetical protein
MKVKKYRIIKVKQEDIDGALAHPFDINQKSYAYNCPVSRAIIRQYRDKNGFAGYTTCKIKGENYDMPEHVTKFIKEFEANINVKPFSFKVKAM